MLADLQGSVNKIKLGKNKGIFSLFEAIVNSIQSNSTLIKIEICRDLEKQLIVHKNSKPIKKVVITDNGNGFNNDNYKSFKTINSTQKIAMGGKGVGRLSWLKVFKNVLLESTFEEGSKNYFRSFEFNFDNEVKENVFKEMDKKTSLSETKIELSSIHDYYYDAFPKTARRMADNILYHCLGYFIQKEFEIIVFDEDETINLRAIFNEELKEKIKRKNIKIREYDFEMMYLTLPKERISSHEIGLMADEREVKRKPVATDNNDIFKVPFTSSGEEKYSLTYLKGTYLDDNVTEDRTDFRFSKGSLFLNETEIATAVSKELLNEFENEIETIKQKNSKRIDNFLYENPFYKSLYNYNPELVETINPDISDDSLDEKFYKFAKNQKNEIDKTLKDFTLEGDYNNNFSELIGKIESLNTYELSKYVLHRKFIIEILEKVLQKKENSKNYAYEKDLHNLIYPMKKTSDEINYEDHNLWLLDDRLSLS